MSALCRDPAIEPPTVPLRVREEPGRTRHCYGNNDRCVFCELVRQDPTGREGVVEESTRFLGEVKP